MKVEVHEAEKNALSVQFKTLVQQATLPSLPVPVKQLVPVKLVAPAFQAKRERAGLEAQRRQTAEYARQEQQQRMREEQVSRRATFKVD